MRHYAFVPTATTTAIALALAFMLAACGAEPESVGDTSTFGQTPDTGTDVDGTAQDVSDDAAETDVTTDLTRPDATPGVINVCGGSALLSAYPGVPCGPCNDGVWRCEPGGESVTCGGASTPNACGGCGPLPGTAGSPCGACGGTWQCDPEAGTMVCEGERPRNACGGCADLPVQVGFGCFDGINTCDGPNTVVCRRTGSNPCGGSVDTRFAAPLHSPCGVCDQGVTVCDGSDATTCVDEDLGTNACGGCGPLRGMPDTPCGCGGTWTCGDDGDVTCEGATTRNACGGCAPLDNTVGDTCPIDDTQAGVVRCSGANTTHCQPDARNACGGLVPLGGVPGTACGPCEDGVLQCVSPDDIGCVGASALNACGACGVLQGIPGDACGTDRAWACRGGTLWCSTAVTPNRCGGTAELDVPPGVPCGACDAGIQLCVEENRTACFGGDASARNRCGGCTTLTVDDVPFDDVPGAPCGVCNSGSWSCLDAETIACTGENEASLRTYYADRDGDGFGAADETRNACSLPLGFVENDDDCDDADEHSHPGSVELCDDQDNDCDGDVDEAFLAFVDADGDGFGGVSEPVVACAIVPGLSRNQDDCDDTTPNAFPGQTDGFTTPRADGSYDWNCDGEEEPLLDRLRECRGPPLCSQAGFGTPQEGWALTTPPSCGESGPWMTNCHLQLEGCVAVVDEDPRRQVCR